MWNFRRSMDSEDNNNNGSFRKLEKIEHNLSTESDFSDSDQEKPKSIIRKSNSSNGHSGSSSRKSILVRRHSEPSSPEDACSSSRGSECLSGHGGDSSTGHLASTASTAASVHVGGATDDVITILVENTRFIVNPALFRSHPETMLGRMFSINSINSSITRPNERGEFEITENISAACFRTILDFYNEGTIHCPDSLSVQEVRDACDYFLIPFNTETVKCQNLRSLLQEISNQGAKEQFAHFIESLVMPVLVQIAQQGEREGHIVVLAEDDQFQWDDEYPPPLGEEPSQMIRNNSLYRFFRYVENRDVAKVLLKERGFKKVRLGVEGFPTTLEKVKKKAGGRIEVIYNYIQRAFMHMSWEEEDAKSRHVDFQCIRLKTKTNPAPLVVAAADTEQDVAAVQQAVVEIANDPAGGQDGAANAGPVNVLLINDQVMPPSAAGPVDGGAYGENAPVVTGAGSSLQAALQVVRIPSPSSSPSENGLAAAGVATSGDDSSSSATSSSTLTTASSSGFGGSNSSGLSSIAIGGLGVFGSSSASSASTGGSMALPLFQQMVSRVSPYRERIVHLAANNSNTRSLSSSGSSNSGSASSGNRQIVIEDDQKSDEDDDTGRPQQQFLGGSQESSGGFVFKAGSPRRPQDPNR